MADETKEPEMTTNDVIVELEQGLRSFKAFEHAKQVVDYMLTIEARQKEAEERLAKTLADGDSADEALRVRIKIGEERAEAAERRAAAADKKVAEATTKADNIVLEAKRASTEMVIEAQAKVAESRKELTDLQKQVSDLKAKLKAGLA